MPENAKKPVPGSFSKLMSPTPPGKAETKNARAHVQKKTEGATGKVSKHQNDKGGDQSREKPPGQLTKKTFDQPIGQSTSQSTESTDGPIQQQFNIVRRPKAFYITEDIDNWINKAVEHFRSRGLKKVDRSTVVSAILHDPELWRGKSLDRFTERVIRHLTSRSIG